MPFEVAVSVLSSGAGLRVRSSQSELAELMGLAANALHLSQPLTIVVDSPMAPHDMTSIAASGKGRVTLDLV